MKKPKKAAGDGAVSLNRRHSSDGKKRLSVTVNTDGELQTVLMSEYNAWRVFGLLAIALQITLPPEIAEKMDL